LALVKRLKSRLRAHGGIGVPDRTLWTFWLFGRIEPALALAAQGEAVERAEIVLRSLAEGRNAWLSITARPLADGSGAIRGGVAVVRDITSQVEAERKLLQSERLAAIGQMVAGVAHESRNVLQQIQACCGLLSWKLDGNEESLELLRDVDRAKQRLQRPFDDLRGYAAPRNSNRVIATCGRLSALPGSRWRSRAMAVTHHCAKRRWSRTRAVPWTPCS
jgi:signal transduction histidine kinase